MLESHAFYKCPTCGAYLYSSSLHCGNTIGAKFYSDGKMFAPMWPEFPDFTKCEECGTIIMLSRLEWFLGSALELGFYECQPLTIGDLYRIDNDTSCRPVGRGICHWPTGLQV